jgi:hypothetical protein
MKLNKTSWKTLYGASGTEFPNNTTGLITELVMRTNGENVADSYMSIDDNFIDEDSFASDSATKAPSQQSVKAYADSLVGAAGLLKVTVPMTANQIKGMPNAPFQIIAAPGANKFIQYVFACFVIDYGTTPFNFPATGLYGLKENIEVSGGSFTHTQLNASADVVGILSDKWGFQGAIVGVDSAINQPLTFTRISGTGTDATTGDSTGKWIVYYRIIDLS